MAWVREIAAVVVIEAIAKQRLQRGGYHKQIAAQERAEIQQGDFGDIWCDPPNKDTPGRRGPAQIASVNLGEGNVTVRFQGRTLDGRHQEARVHVLYLVYQVCFLDCNQQQWGALKRGAENLTSAFVILGGWHLTPRSSHADGKRCLLVAFVIAANVLHLERVACIRACRGVFAMLVLNKFVSCEVLVWFRGNTTEEVVLFTLEAGDLGQIFPSPGIGTGSL